MPPALRSSPLHATRLDATSNHQTTLQEIIDLCEQDEKQLLDFLSDSIRKVGSIRTLQETLEVGLLIQSVIKNMQLALSIATEAEEAASTPQIEHDFTQGFVGEETPAHHLHGRPDPELLATGMTNELEASQNNAARTNTNAVDIDVHTPQEERTRTRRTTYKVIVQDIPTMDHEGKKAAIERLAGENWYIINDARNAIISVAWFDHSPNSRLSVGFSNPEDANTAIDKGLMWKGEWKRAEIHRRYRSQCHNCWAFDHSESKCYAAAICGRCAGPHQSKDCSSDTVECVNCHEPHVAWSSQCILRQRARKEAIEKMMQMPARYTVPVIPEPVVTSGVAPTNHSFLGAVKQEEPCHKATWRFEHFEDPEEILLSPPKQHKLSRRPSLRETVELDPIQRCPRDTSWNERKRKSAIPANPLSSNEEDTIGAKRTKRSHY